MISTFDLKIFNEILKDIKSQYPDKSVRFHCFLATCLYLDADIKLDYILKSGSFGALIGIDISTLDKQLKQFKLEYMLNCMTQQDICKKNHTSPGYTYAFPCSMKNS